MWLPSRSPVLLLALIIGGASSSNGANGTIVQLFQWRWDDVAQECCAFLGPNGFDAVQVSPPMEQITAPQWWASYQPVSYRLGNRLGDEAAFQSMIASCRKCGIKIIADAVTNHMAAGSGTGSSGSPFGGRGYPGTYSAPDFHHNPGDTSTNCQISNYQDRQNVQKCDLVGLPDLDSSADWPRRRLGAYLGSLGALGVAGFRVDAAKHQDAHALGQILSANGSACGLEVYQEVIGAPGEAVQPIEYIHNGLVTEFGYSYGLSSAVRDGQLSSLPGVSSRSGLLPSASALAFLDNHDSQRSASYAALGADRRPRTPYSIEARQLLSGVLTYKDGELYAVGAAFLLAWPYGRVRLMSSFYFDDPDAGPPATPVFPKSGDAACGGSHPWGNNLAAAKTRPRPCL
jgi:alpha-amylase